MKYGEREVLGIIANEIEQALGRDGDEVTQNRIDAWDAYFTRARGDERPGRSGIQSSDVADMTNAVMSQLVPMWQDQVIVIEPNGQEDEEQAQMESHTLNTVFMEHNQGFVEMYEAAKSALLERNGWFCIHVKDREDTQRAEFANEPSEEEWAVLLEPRATNERREKAGKKAMRIITTIRRFVVESVPPSQMIYDNQADSMELQEQRFLARRHMMTRSDLIEMGVDKAIVDELPAHGENTKTDEQAYKRSETTNYDAQTHDQDIIEVFQCWLLIDQDGDGISERWEIYVEGRGSNFLMQNEVNYIPMATGTPFIHPHRLMGESLADHLFQIQNAKTDALRQWVDNLRVANNSRVAAVEDQVELEDLLNSRPGGVVRVDSVDSILPLPFNDVGGSAVSLLEYMDKIRTERGGAALDMLSSDKQIVGDTAHGIERQYASKELMVSMFARSLSETLIRNMYLVLHRTMRENSNQPIMVKMAGVWQEVDPTQWPARDRVNVLTGVTPGQRGHIQNMLGQWLQLQSMAMQMGVPVADPGTIYRTVSSWLSMGGLENVDRYVVDPSSPDGMAMLQSSQQAAEQEKQVQQQMVQMQAQLEQMKLELDKYKHDSELEWKYYDSALDADVKEAEATVDAAVKLKQSREAAANGSAAGTGQGDSGQ
jgi:hypothetical protein